MASNDSIERRPFDTSQPDGLLAAIAARPAGAQDAALQRLLLCELPRSPEHVIDLFCAGDRVLVASVIDTVQSSANAAVFEVLLWRENAPGAIDAFAHALELAETLAGAGPQRRLETPIYAALAAAVPLLEERGHALAFSCYDMQTQGDAIVVEAPPLPAGWRWVDVGDAELPTYRDVLAEAFAKVPGANVGSVEQLRTLLERLPRPPRMLLDDSNAAAGVARVSLAADGATGVVDSIARAKERRGEGLGVLLMVESLRCLRALDAERFFLSVAVENKAALALYERFGFSVVHVEPSYHSPDLPAKGACFSPSGREGPAR